ncbi:xanthine dehydrogenase family protein molybdopterin-binding subunit [Pseudenhygromyxa sp. WMMC2535]|uniref:xanthine dehydrogenase family protein molybdopterin-binding subunit n=1 Tax=Pseudenhygromyxa sp. WMMC2535 TaxID=2712867 RepID=UPI00155481BC|nr:xanthine dehydrogenase family protein molybdopterin-binding subunit [Pseudenhygromyxa sp. WMMC2535]NVB38988.1 xanthine dehydrogenase family protein molybdopterin-binding subunit [Pseudenhygromyxa sp. WMMC2535]
MPTVKLRLGYADQVVTKSVDIPEGEPTPWDGSVKTRVVGRPAPRIEGDLKVSGEARYTHDIKLPKLLHAAILRSPHPCAKLTALDLEPALRMPGVEAAIPLASVGARMLYAGQDVAAVAAARPEQARAALEAIVADYAVQPFVIGTRAAMDEGAPRVHQGAVEEKRTGADEPGAEKASGALQGNVRPGRSQKRGDAKKAMRAAKLVFEAEYETQCHTHSALETHGLVFRWDGADAVTVWASTQSIFSVRDEVAALFGLEPAKVRVITKFMGGGFGAKFGANAPGTAIGKAAGELARATGKPVKLMLDRSEEHRCTGYRPDSIQRVRLGADPKSKAITAIHVQAHGSAGVGTGAGVGRNASAVYTKVPDVLVESADVFTHAGPAVAFRAPGHTQGAFAMESAMDELARAMGTDPIALRLAHDTHPLRRWQLELGRDRFDWAARRAESAARRERDARIRRGVGCAVSIWGDFGTTDARVEVSVSRGGRIEVRDGVQDIGSGITTVMAQVAAEVFGQPLDSVRVELGDSLLGPGVGSGGSKTTSSITPAVRNAAEAVKAELANIAAEALEASSPSKLRWGPDGSISLGRQSLSWAELCKRIDGEAVVSVASRPRTYAAHPKSFPGFTTPQAAGVQFAEVEIDSWTGVVRCTQILAIHDCGRVMNPTTTRSQINGGIILGVGYALMEQRIMDPSLGVMLNANFEAYKPCGAKDVPEIAVILTEVASGNNATGAYGIGEPATIPTAAAIANAVGDALGAHVRSLPITPAKVLEALERARRARAQGAD